MLHTEFEATPVTIVQLATDDVLVVQPTETTDAPSVIHLTATQATTIHKLLSMPGDPIPEYRSEAWFALGESVPNRPDDSPGPFLEANDGDLRLSTDQNGHEIHIKNSDLPAIREHLSESGYTMEAQQSVISFPPMCQLEDGICEPLIHVDHGEILEHYHQPIGYWSPSQEEYLVEH